VTSITHSFSTGDLIAELASRAPALGGNQGEWPGLTIYNFTEPVVPQWEEIQSMSLGIVAQGRKAVVVDGRRLVYDPFNYLVLGNRLSFTAEIVEASARRPFLSFVLQIEPAIVRKISGDMMERRTALFGREQVPGRPGDGAGSSFVSVLDAEMMSAVLRFLWATRSPADRRVVAPLCVDELVYRILQREQYNRLLSLAARETAANPVSSVLAYVSEHLDETLSVAELAEQVSLSPSAFTRLFRGVTGKSPYQFVKEMRLNKARELLADGKHGVAQVSRTVGYSSVSHFINEFRSQFGTTPGSWADTRVTATGLGALRAAAAD
jgi:AraC-like DNA-binding protein